jgi:hypothetical protein
MGTASFVIVTNGRRFLGLAVLLVLMTMISGCAGGSLPAHVVDGPSSAGVRQADITVLSGADTIDLARTVGTASLYRVATAKGNGTVPSAKATHAGVDIHLTHLGSGHGSNLSVLLAPGVDWSIRLAGGATDERLDLSRLEVSDVTVPAGVSHLSMRLPAPRGTSNISVAGGASAFDVVAPMGVTVRIDFIGGAGRATLDGVQHSGLAGNTTLTSSGSATTGSIDVTCPGGIGSFTLTRDSA